MNKIRTKLFALGVSCLLLFAIGCGSVLAYVNDDQITQQEFDSRFNKMKAVYELQGTNFDGVIGKKILPGLQQDVLDELIQEKLMLQEAKRRGITVSDQVIDQRLVKVKQSFKSSEDYQESLDIQHIDEDGLRKYLYVQAIKKRLQEQLRQESSTKLNQGQGQMSVSTDANFQTYLAQLKKKAKIRQIKKFD